MLFQSKERLSRSFAKAVSWRILGSVDTFILGYVFTGSAEAAGGIAAAEVLTKSLLYTGHEQLWARVGWGRNAQKNAPNPDTPVDPNDNNSDTAPSPLQP